MDEIVPAGAQVFRMEAGFDPFIAWLDELTGDTDGPRALPKVNERRASSRSKTAKTTPSPADIKLVARYYGADFERFGYDPEVFGQGRSSSSKTATSPTPRPIKGILRAIGLS